MLAQSGTTKPLIVISQFSPTRSNWSSATSEKTTTATLVNGFKRASRWLPSSIDQFDLVANVNPASMGGRHHDGKRGPLSGQ